MGETIFHTGCQGCVDCGAQLSYCEYLHNHGHVRPCPAGPSGCVLKAATRDEQARLEKAHAWDTERAMRLLKEGTRLAEAARQVGASMNALQAWVARRAPGMLHSLNRGAAAPDDGMARAGERSGAEEAGKTPRSWEREEEYRALYNKGLTDPEAARVMGLSTTMIYYRRRQLGLESNRFRRCKG